MRAEKEMVFEILSKSTRDGAKIRFSTTEMVLPFPTWYCHLHNHYMFTGHKMFRWITAEINLWSKLKIIIKKKNQD